MAPVMACFHPLKAFLTASGGVVFAELARHDIVRNIELPCGQCIGCRLERSRQWAIRCMHEASMHSENSFLTLTYAPEHLPSDGSLNHRHFQLFMKRLRKRSGRKLRFYMCGEYGENFERPHYHALIFGFDFPDKSFWSSTPAGSKVYRSAMLEELWPFGFSLIGDVTFQSAAYVSRYIMKKITGDPADVHYRTVDLSTGELVQLKPEYNRMSLRGGIGKSWFDKFSSDVYPHDHVIVNGHPTKPPRYYDRQLAKSDPEAFEEIAFKRELDARSRSADNTDARLLVREQVVKARLSKLKRGYE